jgi:hypothetical protein
MGRSSSSIGDQDAPIEGGFHTTEARPARTSTTATAKKNKGTAWETVHRPSRPPRTRRCRHVPAAAPEDRDGHARR